MKKSSKIIYTGNKQMSQKRRVFEELTHLTPNFSSPVSPNFSILAATATNIKRLHIYSLKYKKNTKVKVRKEKGYIFTV